MQRDTGGLFVFGFFTLLALACVGALVLQGCASFGLKPYSAMTLEEKSLFLLKQYNKTYDNTFNQVLDPSLTCVQKDSLRAAVLAGVISASDIPLNPNLTLEQKKVINAKKEILTKLHPLVLIFKTVVDGGGTPSAETEQQILDLIDQAAALGTGV
jgi:hypothetical protein